MAASSKLFFANFAALLSDLCGKKPLTAECAENAAEFAEKVKLRYYSIGVLH